MYMDSKDIAKFEGRQTELRGLTIAGNLKKQEAAGEKQQELENTVRTLIGDLVRDSDIPGKEGDTAGFIAQELRDDLLD